MAMDETTRKMKEMEISEGRAQMYHFTFIGTVETYDSLLDQDMTEFRFVLY